MLLAPAHGFRALVITGFCLFAWPAWGQLVLKQPAAETPAESAPDGTNVENGEPGDGQPGESVEGGTPRTPKADEDLECLYNLAPLPADSPAHRFYQALVRRLPDFSSARTGHRGRARSKADGATACPLCGQARHGDGNAAVASDLPISALERSPFRSESGPGAAADKDDEQAERLRSGEPAEVILEMRKRLGASMLDGTDFSGPPDVLVKWIRALDAENRLRQTEEDPADGEDECASGPERDIHEQVKALREASRQLQAAAELLEDQNLFESSDHVRELADHLRQQSREQLGE